MKHLFAATIISLALSGNTFAESGHMHSSSPKAKQALFDLQFLDTMRAHHQAAVDMAELGLKNAGDNRIKTLSKNIIMSQNQEIGVMESAREKYYPENAPALNMHMAGMHESMKDMDMGKLKKAKGRAFDVMFAEQMIPHHEGAVTMCEEAKEKATLVEVKNLCQNIVPAQSKEITEMQSWLEEWKSDAKK